MQSGTTGTVQKAVEVSPLLARLRSETRDLHTRAERHPVQAAMVRGQSGRGEYAAYLSQMWHIHDALERELERRAGSPALAPVGPEQFRAERVLEDLRALDAGAPEPPTQPAARFAATVAQASDEELLGMHYVLEGSTNGGRFISQAVRRGLGLHDAGTAYLDPYGDEQKARWGAFCAGMNRLEMEPAAHDEVVAGAASMFTLIIEVFDAMPDAAAQPA